jgi:hypothetical protein
MRCNEVQGVTVPAVDVSKCIADADRVLQHGCKHTLKITGRAADNLKHLRGRRLSLQGLVQFAGEPSDLRLIASRGRIGTCYDLRHIAALRLWRLATPSFKSVRRLLWSASSSPSLYAERRHRSRSKGKAGRDLFSFVNRALRRQLLQQRLRVDQIARIEPFRKPPVHRSK